MASELSTSIAFAFQKGNGTEIAKAFVGLLRTISGSTPYFNSPSVGFAAEEAMPLGDVTAAGAWVVMHNTDDTNFCHWRTATGAANAVKIPAGLVVAFYMGSGVTAPFLIADTGAVVLEYWVIPA